MEVGEDGVCHRSITGEFLCLCRLEEREKSWG